MNEFANIGVKLLPIIISEVKVNCIIVPSLEITKYLKFLIVEVL